MHRAQPLHSSTSKPGSRSGRQQVEEQLAAARPSRLSGGAGDTCSSRLGQHSCSAAYRRVQALVLSCPLTRRPFRGTAYLHADCHPSPLLPC